MVIACHMVHPSVFSLEHPSVKLIAQSCRMNDECTVSDHIGKVPQQAEPVSLEMETRHPLSILLIGLLGNLQVVLHDIVIIVQILVTPIIHKSQKACITRTSSRINHNESIVVQCGILVNHVSKLVTQYTAIVLHYLLEIRHAYLIRAVHINDLY